MPIVLCIPKHKLVDAYQKKGLSVADTAKLLGISKNTVSKYLRIYGIQLRKPGPYSGKKNPAWKGGQTVDTYGYKLIRNPDHPDANGAGYVRAHSLMMESHIGRRLTKTEVVHHKNGNRQDNRIENLLLLENNAQHRKEHACLLDSATLEIIRKWYLEDDITFSEIGSRLVLHYTTVSRGLKINGVKIKGSNYARMIRWPDNLLERYENEKINDLLRSLGVSRYSLYAELKRRGVTPRSRRGRDS